MYGTRTDGIRHLARHLRRLQDSAETLGFALDLAPLRARLSAECAALATDAPHRFRLILERNGDVTVTAASLAPSAPPAPAPALALANHGTVTVLFADEHGFTPTSATDPLLRHKTTRRENYDKAWQQAEKHHAFDMLFFNDQGELTEGGRSNVFVRCDGRWWTPPVSSGLLPGIMRSVLMEDPSMSASERVLHRDDVRQAQALIVCNAVRGVMTATVRAGAYEQGR